MSPAPGEQRTLAEIESQLRRSDPRLAAMFDLLANGGAWPVMRPAPTGRPGSQGRARLVVLAALGMALAVTCIAIAVALAFHSTPPRAGHGSGVSSTSTYPTGRLRSGRLASSR